MFSQECLNSQKQHNCQLNYEYFTTDLTKRQSQDSNKTIQLFNNSNTLNFVNNICNLKTNKTKKIQKIPLKQKLYGFQEVIKQASMNINQQEQYQECIFRQIQTPKLFFIQGDVLVELGGQDNFKSEQIFSEFRNLKCVVKTNDSISFHLETIRPLKQFTKLVYCLEGSQDQSKYQFAQCLKSHQLTVNKLSEQVHNAIQYYQNNSFNLQSLSIQREEYVNQLRQKLVSELVSNDEFCCVLTVSISYSNQTSTLSKMTITKPTLALIGAEEEEMAQQFMRQGFVKLFNQRTRKLIFQNSMEFLQRRDNMLEVTIPQFELTTIDDIVITCQCNVKRVSIQFPEHLLIQGENINILNSVEQLIVFKFQITPHHLKKILEIRGSYNQKTPQNQTFPLNYNYNFADIEDFEYSVRSQMILEKFYQDKIEELKNKQNLKILQQQVEEQQK